MEGFLSSSCYKMIVLSSFACSNEIEAGIEENRTIILREREREREKEGASLRQQQEVATMGVLKTNSYNIHSKFCQPGRIKFILW